MDNERWTTDDGRIAVVKCVYIQHLVTLLAWYSTHSTHSTCPRDRDLVVVARLFKNTIYKSSPERVPPAVPPALPAPDPLLLGPQPQRTQGDGLLGRAFFIIQRGSSDKRQ